MKEFECVLVKHVMADDEDEALEVFCDMLNDWTIDREVAISEVEDEDNN